MKVWSILIFDYVSPDNIFKLWQSFEHSKTCVGPSLAFVLCAVLQCGFKGVYQTRKFWEVKKKKKKKKKKKTSRQNDDNGVRSFAMLKCGCTYNHKIGILRFYLPLFTILVTIMDVPSSEFVGV